MYPSGRHAPYAANGKRFSGSAEYMWLSELRAATPGIPLAADPGQGV